MRIQHNIMAMNAYRNYNTNTSALSKNLEKLSSGYKINRAGDDAAGLAISEKMRAQITGLEAAQKNVKDGVSLVKTAEGAMQEIQDMLNRMDYLATQSANGTYDNEVDRLNLQKEVDQLKTEINRIADSANFNGIKLLDGSLDKSSSAPTAVDVSVKLDACDMGQLHVAGASAEYASFQIDLKQALEGAIASATIAANATFALSVKVAGQTFTVNVTSSKTVAQGAVIDVDSLSFTMTAKEFPSLLDNLIGIFPSNVLDALLNANMLQIIFAAIVLGVGLVKAAPKGLALREWIEAVFDVTIVITNGVMALTPIGILGLMVPTVAANGLNVLLPLGKLILVFYLGVVIQVGITYCLTLKCFSDFSVKEFFRGMLPAQVVAFVSCSSAAALPVSMQRIQSELNVSKEVSGFVLPLGATINMDGNALYQGIVALFVAQAYGMELSLSMQVMVVLTGTLASIGAAGVPGAGMIVLSTVLASVGLPVDGIALVAGIDRVLDMGRTFVNVTGDAVTACVVNGRRGTN